MVITRFFRSLRRLGAQDPDRTVPAVDPTTPTLRLTHGGLRGPDGPSVSLSERAPTAKAQARTCSWTAGAGIDQSIWA